jgi:hypothetical protein
VSIREQGRKIDTTEAIFGEERPRIFGTVHVHSSK